MGDVIPNAVWSGIVATVQALIATGAFGEHFPEVCPDGAGPVGTDEQKFAFGIKAEIPELNWPLKTTIRNEDNWSFNEELYVPETMVVLDLIQFCYMHVAKPIQGRYHNYFKHYHLSFDVEAGRKEFRDKMNRIFSRNDLAYELKENGDIIRLTPPTLGETIVAISFNTGDAKLNGILEDSRRKYLSPDPQVRKEAVERLWDAWERLKTVENPSDKKDSITLLLNKAALEQNFRDLLEEEARKLTSIGNTFHIRHSEVSQTEIREAAHFDYLFHRLFSMILLLINSRD